MSGNTCGVKNNPRPMWYGLEGRAEDRRRLLRVYWTTLGKSGTMLEAWSCRRVATFGNKSAGMGKKVGPRLRESRLLTPSGRSGRAHATYDSIFTPSHHCIRPTCDFLGAFIARGNHGMDSLTMDALPVVALHLFTKVTKFVW